MNLERLALHAADSYRWCRSRQDESGGWRDQSATDFTTYYKAPLSFFAAGDPTAAANSLAHIQSHFLYPDGDLGPINNETIIARHPLYPHGHIAAGAARIGRLDIADQVLNFLATQRHARLTAWGDRQETDGPRQFDSISTACIGWAFLERGDLDQAGGAVEFLSRLLALQPKPEIEFFTSISDDGTLITAPRKADPGRVFSVRLAARFQVWWAISFPLILLARFAGITNDLSAWQTATRYLALLDRSPQAWNDLSAGKLALGCALMYRHHGDSRHKGRALQAARAVVSRITGDGGWRASGGGEGTPLHPTPIEYEVNLEFALTLAWAGRSLAERDGVAFPDPARLVSAGAAKRWICQSERAMLGFAREKSYHWHATRRKWTAPV